jgi:hypothetical protein
MSIVTLPKISELQHIFPSEEAAIDFCQELGILLKPEIICEYCNIGKLFYCKPKVLRCSKHDCRKKISIMKNTFFYNSKVPINVVLSIGYDILAGSRTQEIVIHHDLSPTTVTDWCGFYRDLLSEDIAYTTMNENNY